MGFHKKIKEYFEKQNISNRQIAEVIGYSDVMTGRYLKSSKPNYEFILALKKAYPDIDLNYLFEDDEGNSILNEDGSNYKNPEVIIDKIDYQLKELRRVLAQNSHN